MSKQSEDALASVKRIVFQSSEPVVVALTGGWGEGKTYFWKEVVIPSQAGRKPGYVSVFGAESLAVIRERVVVASIGLLKVTGADSQRKWLRTVKSLFATARGAWNSYGSKFGVSDSFGVELLQCMGLKSGWVICLDDVERLSEKVGFENFLGYVTELRDRWQLKVVLIYNRALIDKDIKNQFHIYEEKVIDRSIAFELDLTDVVALVFKDVQIAGIDVSADVLKRALVLALRNIRILVKARNYFEEVCHVLSDDAEPEYLRATLASLLLFCYVKFSNQKPSGLTFEMLANYSEWEDRLNRTAASRGGKEIEQLEPAKEFLQKYQYVVTDEMDRLLISFVHTDVLDANKLRALHTQYQQDESKRVASKRLHDVIDIYYHGTFRDNPDELCDALLSAIPPYLPYIPPGELDFSLAILSIFGKEAKAKEMFDDFKSIRGSEFELLEADSVFIREPYSYAPLSDYLQRIKKDQDVDERSLETVMEGAFHGHSIDSADCARLADFSDDELVTYLLTHDQLKLTSKLASLAKSNNPKVRALAIASAGKIAATNKINRKRIVGMGLFEENKNNSI